jgi:hypothetical protein
VLVDPQDDRLRVRVEMKLEIGVAEAVRQRLEVEHTALWKGGLNQAGQQRRRQRPAGFGPDPARLLRGAREHGKKFRKELSAFSDQRSAISKRRAEFTGGKNARRRYD